MLLARDLVRAGWLRVGMCSIVTKSLVSAGSTLFFWNHPPPRWCPPSPTPPKSPSSPSQSQQQTPNHAQEQRFSWQLLLWQKTKSQQSQSHRSQQSLSQSHSQRSQQSKLSQQQYSQSQPPQSTKSQVPQSPKSKPLQSQSAIVHGCRSVRRWVHSSSKSTLSWYKGLETSNNWIEIPWSNN